MSPLWSSGWCSLYSSSSKYVFLAVVRLYVFVGCCWCCCRWRCYCRCCFLCCCCCLLPAAGNQKNTQAKRNPNQQNFPTKKMTASRTRQAHQKTNKERGYLDGNSGRRPEFPCKFPAPRLSVPREFIHKDIKTKDSGRHGIWLTAATYLGCCAP